MFYDYEFGDEMLCPSCGEPMSEWDYSVYECLECGTMIDTDIFVEDIEDTEEDW